MPMNFPLLIKLEHKKIAYIAKSLDELPLNENFKIVRSNPKPEDLSFDLDYKVINNGICTCNPWFHELDKFGNKHCRACNAEWPLQENENVVEPINDEPTQEDNGSVGDSSS